jgi:Zn-dependent protease
MKFKKRKITYSHVCRGINLKGTIMATGMFVYIVILFFSAIIHEMAHGYVAYLKGDNTAKMAERISLNPIVHMELFGSVLFPAILLFLKEPIIFGWAKPVPVNRKNLKNPKTDFLLVSIAGPVSNMLLAVFSGLGMRFIKMFPNFEFSVLVESFLYIMLRINAVLMVVHLMPVPTLDGAKIITCFLPEKIAAKYLDMNPYVCLIMLLILLSPAGSSFMYPVIKFFMKFFNRIAF